LPFDGDIIEVSNKQSWVSGDIPIRVYNIDTPEWKDVAEEFSQYDWGTNFPHWVSKDDGKVKVIPGERGNHPVHAGYSQQNQPKRTSTTKLAVPGYCKETEENIPTMVLHSKLATKVRYRKFALRLWKM